MSLSKPVISLQIQPHSRTTETALRHAVYPWLRPVSQHSLVAFQQVLKWKKEFNGPLWLDVGCGTGSSTACLAKIHPECLIIGVDKSHVRLNAHQGGHGHYRLLRTNLEDFWKLCFEHQIQFSGQTFFYPNPWPKPQHRMRRWSQHPVFPYALACGGFWELRTNWLIYAQEFVLAIEALVGVEPEITLWQPKEFETLFERKYALSGHSLWRVVVQLPSQWKPAFSFSCV